MVFMLSCGVLVDFRLPIFEELYINYKEPKKG